MYEPQDKLDEPPAVAKRISKSGETSTRLNVGDFRNTVTDHYIAQVSVNTLQEQVIDAL